ncbi:hypothetical protein [Microbacterium sp. H1-D42]|uniref:hypothetical protein n=1 Tax=Microbacterium sp. H1-D42 TaxID=2925844 RepID=UPI001F530EE5|nr:hypothetical protein [Microbacterium sp. H1-D42]UNK70560.1 hypothetical protein MNR00_15580 [Microbacterium sp. H1-D42]
MSTDDADHVSSDPERDEAGTRRMRWPMSRVNTVLIAICVIAAIVCFVMGQPYAGTVVLLGGIVAAAGAIFARRSRSGDLERVNALEYADERDRVAATKGLAAVGVLALVLSAVQLVVHVIVDTDSLSRTMSVVTFLTLIVGWMLANWFFVRRG